MIRQHPTADARRFALACLLALASACGGGGSEPEPGCEGDADCAAGERCAPGGRCVAGAECLAEKDCAAVDPRTTCDLATLECVFLPGFADECDADRPCAFGQFCSPLLGRCLDAAGARDCVRRAQCPSDQLCDRAANKCIPGTACYGDAFCEDGEVCNPVDRSCRAVAVECTSCALAGTCPADTLCFVNTEECLAPGATPACREGERCDPLGRCVQCTSSADCGPGLFCNVPLGRCESNVRCVDDPSECPAAEEVNCVTCEAPEICDARSRRCQAPATPCENDLDCPGDQLCDQALPEPVCVPRVPDCLDDLLDEPRNDSVAEARALEPGEGPRFGELKLCPANQDWYRLDVVAGTLLTVDARFRHEDGDVELQLFLADGRSLVDESRSTTDNERVQVEVGTDLTLYLRVFVARPTIRPVPYELVVARDPGAACPDDAGEPDDIRAQARLLEPGQPVEARLCTGDPDWYVLRGVEAGARVRVDLDFVDALGDLDLELLRADNPTPFQVSASLDDGERVEFDAPYRGDYLVRVAGKGADANVYTVRAEVVSGAGAGCRDDRLEPNQGISTATPFGTVPRGPQVLSLCAGDEDWFLVRLMPGEALSAEITFDPGADLDLALYPATIDDPDTSPMELANGLYGRELVTHQSFTGGDFLLRVHAPDDRAAASYQLRLAVVTPGICQPDAFDRTGRGNSLATAADLPFPPSRLDDLTMCSGDTDFFRIFIAGGFVNVIRLSYLVDLTELDFEVLDATGARLFDSAASLPRGLTFKEVQAAVPGSGFGLLYVRVYTNGPFETPYHLTMDLEPIYSCFPDRAEPNDSAALASLVASSTVSPVRAEDLSLCASERGATGGDEDWHRIVPPRVGARIEARIDFPQGDLSLELFSPGGARRACAGGGRDRCFSDGFGLSETVTFTATTTAPYLLKVGSVYSAPQAFVRPAEADTPYDLTVTYGP